MLHKEKATVLPSNRLTRNIVDLSRSKPRIDDEVERVSSIVPSVRYEPACIFMSNEVEQFGPGQRKQVNNTGPRCRPRLCLPCETCRHSGCHKRHPGGLAVRYRLDAERDKEQLRAHTASR